MVGEFSAGNRGAVDLSAMKARAESASTGSGADATANYVMAATEANFDEVVQLSQQVPVVVELWTAQSEASTALTPILKRVVAQLGGRLVLATINVDENPQLAQAFQAQSIPTVVAILGGRPAALFAGALPEEQVREVLTRLLDAATQMGIAGTVGPLPNPEPDEKANAEDAAQAEEAPISPVAEAAQAALDAGDLVAAADVFEKAIVANPRDDESIVGLARVKLLQRIAAGPGEATGAGAVLAQADQLFASQMFESALSSLLDAWSQASDTERETIRARLLEYFTLLGTDSPFVPPARARLASLLY